MSLKADSAKFTPGPWTASWSMAGVWMVKCGGHPHALHDFTLKSDREADAKLIASAPDLLEALQAFIERFGWIETSGKGPTLERDSEVFAQAHDAIAKATAS